MTDYVDTIIDILKFWGNNLRTNFKNIFEGTTTEQYIQLVAIVGAYLLLRPYLLKFAEKSQAKQHEKEMEAAKSNATKAKISPNSLRGNVEVQEDSDEEEDDKTSGPSWGKKARKRQRDYVKRVVDEEERRAQEIEDALDDDIKDLLED